MTNKELIEEIRNRVVYVMDKHPANDWDEGWNMALRWVSDVLLKEVGNAD